MKIMQTALAALSLFFCALNSNAQNGNFKIPNDRKINIGVLVYDGVEIVDTGGPIDVFVKANNILGNTKYTLYQLQKKRK